MNPYIVLVLLLAGIAGGRHWGVVSTEAGQAREDKVAQVATDAASRAAGQAIAGIKINHQNIYSEFEREIQTNTVYVDCRHSPDGLRLVNDALRGAQRPGAGQLPPADPAH